MAQRRSAAIRASKAAEVPAREILGRKTRIALHHDLAAEGENGVHLAADVIDPSLALAADAEEARHELPDEGRHAHQQVRDRLGRHPLSGACTVALELDPEVGIARPDKIVENRQEVLQALRIEEVGVLETGKTQGEHRLGAIGAVLREVHRVVFSVQASR